MKHFRIVSSKNKLKLGDILKNVIISIAYLLIAQVHASEKMVFLVEGEAGKHVGESIDFKNYKLHTQGDLWNLYPAVSSDGKSIAWVRGEGQDSLELVVQKEGGVIESFGSKAFQLQPRFSNNGQKVFYSKKAGEKNHIVVLDLKEARAAQGQIEPEVLSASEGYFPAPFQNGEKVVYQRNTDKKEIVLLNLLDKKEELLDLGMAPSLSKDERYVAYTKKVNGNWDIYIYDLFKKTITRATTQEGLDFSPSFDSEGNLFYTSDRLEPGVFSIFSQSKDSWMKGQSREKVRISKKGVSFYAPRISGEIEINSTKKANMIGSPRSSFGAIHHQGKVYVAGGHQGAEHTYPPESFTGRTDVYDLKTNKWTNIAPRNYKCHGFSLAAYGDYVYAFGGFAYEESTSPKWKSLDVVERYDTKTDKWEVVAHMPRRRSSNVVAQVGSKVYLIGGWDSTPKFEDDVDGTFHDEIDVFDLETETFKTLSAKLPKKRRAFSGFVKDGMIYLAGGISEGASHFGLLDDFTAFDPVTESFSELPKLPFGTFAPAAGALGDKALVFGGMLKKGEWEYEYISHIYSFDFEAQKWSNTGRYLGEDKGFSQVVNLPIGLGVLGGHSYKNNSDSPVLTFEVFSK